MPRPSKGARLYWRKPDGARSGQWVIREGQKQRATGTTDLRHAEAILADYIAERDRGFRGPSQPEEMTVAEVLDIYGREHAPHVKDPARIGYAIDALLPFWGDRPVAAITKATCRRYATTRGASDGTIRKELGTLKAALRYCLAEGALLRVPVVTMPPKPAPRDRVLSREEVARLIRAARSNPDTRHVARFILLAMTGTRKQAILALRFDRHPSGGWIDVERGVMYRKAAEELETAKRRPPVKLPRRLLSHCRRWAREGGWAVSFRGNRVGSIRSAWATVRKEAGVEDVTPHTFRHTAITWAMHAGVPLADAAGYFGATIQTLEANYLHLRPDFQEQTAAAMDRAGR